MSDSIQEEVLAALWAICALLAFGFGFNGWGLAFSIKSVFDIFCALRAAAKELALEKRLKEEAAEAGEVA